jgi:uracil phosphoribosyltransferase
MTINLSQNNTILQKFIAEIRDTNIQKDRMRFRRNIERIGEIFAYEISKTLTYETSSVTTPLGTAEIPKMVDQLILGCVLRASLPLHTGLLNYFDDADNAFISAYRKHHKDGSFEIEVEYLSSPSIEDKVVILADPMLATGRSMIMSYEALLLKGRPKHTHFAAVIASSEGLANLENKMLPNTTIWVAVVDDELTAQAYIVPGLGDAGDLAYGSKEDNE